eukprot:gene3110-biopygen18674
MFCKHSFLPVSLLCLHPRCGACGAALVRFPPGDTLAVVCSFATPAHWGTKTRTATTPSFLCKAVLSPEHGGCQQRRPARRLRVEQPQALRGQRVDRVGDRLVEPRAQPRGAEQRRRALRPGAQRRRGEQHSQRGARAHLRSSRRGGGAAREQRRARTASSSVPRSRRRGERRSARARRTHPLAQSRRALPARPAPAPTPPAPLCPADTEGGRG